MANNQIVSLSFFYQNHNLTTINLIYFCIVSTYRTKLASF